MTSGILVLASNLQVVIQKYPEYLLVEAFGMLPQQVCQLKNHCGMVDAGCNIWNWQHCCEFKLDLEIVADQLGLTCA